jgi:hypothetical protein
MHLLSVLLLLQGRGIVLWTGARERTLHSALSRAARARDQLSTTGGALSSNSYVLSSCTWAPTQHHHTCEPEGRSAAATTTNLQPLYGSRSPRYCPALRTGSGRCYSTPCLLSRRASQQVSQGCSVTTGVRDSARRCADRSELHALQHRGELRGFGGVTSGGVWDAKALLPRLQTLLRALRSQGGG